VLDLSPLRAQFPALRETVAGRPAVFLDGPGGTQVSQSVINAMADCLTRANANRHGSYLTSRRAEETIAAARQAMADFLNAPSPDEIVFGPNMTTLTFIVSRAVGRLLQPGDEVVVTRLDHDANVSPWTALAERGAVIRRVDFHEEDCTLDLDDLRSKIGARTRLVAVGYASNAVGTINDVQTIVELAHAAGAWVYVDAVHYAPHGPIDVQALGCDFLVCSVYKFFGPHVGVLWGRYDLLDRLPAYKVRPAGNAPPDKFEVGTQNHEGMAGTTAAVDYLASVGQHFGEDFIDRFPGFTGRRLQLKAGLSAIQSYERGLAGRLVAGLQSVPSLRIYGITDPIRFAWRVPTVSFTLEGFSPQQVAARLGEQGIFVWNGNFYAINVTERLGLEDKGGLVRVGAVHYNTTAEVERLEEAVRGIA
jgi:cysteine desulfurase family protein (TIGR01976 family)